MGGSPETVRGLFCETGVRFDAGVARGESSGAASRDLERGVKYFLEGKTSKTKDLCQRRMEEEAQTCFFE